MDAVRTKAGRGTEQAPAVAIGDVPLDRPIMLLDVDGVLNAYDHGREPSPYQPKVEESPEPYEIDMSETIVLPGDKTKTEIGHGERREYLIHWSSGLMRDIAQASDEGRVALLWLTSWNGDAGILADRLLWPGRPSPVIGYVDAKAGAERCTYASKRVAMKAVCDAMASARPDDPMPIISFDDDMPWDASMWGGAVEFPKFFHGIATDPRHGITKSQLMLALGIVEQATEDKNDGEGD